MYAAVRAGESGVLVSNDEMRDHTFQLLAPRYAQRASHAPKGRGNCRNANKVFIQWARQAAGV